MKRVFPVVSAIIIGILLAKSMFNQYNQVALIAFLTEIGNTPEKIADAIKDIKIVKTRFSE